MKIKLSVSEECYERIRDELTAAGFEIDDDAEFVLAQRGRFKDYLPVLNGNGERVHVNMDDIIFIESFGHSVEVHTTGNVYKTTDRLYQLTAALDPEKFLRVSNSVIIAKGKIKHMKPTFSMKFVLLMSDGSYVDVTRSYYSSFKESMGL